MQRRKGQVGEREVARLIRNYLHIDVHRNWQAQSAEGGDDLVGLKGFAIEIKRAKQGSIAAWWRQTEEQAAATNVTPVLIYRLDGRDRGKDLILRWYVRVPLCSLVDDDIDKDHVAEITLKAWMDLLQGRAHFSI